MLSFYIGTMFYLIAQGAAINSGGWDRQNSSGAFCRPAQGNAKLSFPLKDMHTAQVIQENLNKMQNQERALQLCNWVPSAEPRLVKEFTAKCHHSSRSRFLWFGTCSVEFTARQTPEGWTVWEKSSSDSIWSFGIFIPGATPRRMQERAVWEGGRAVNDVRSVSHCVEKKAHSILCGFLTSLFHERERDLTKLPLPI